MTQMIHKPVQDRSARRRRYIAVVDLFRQRFGCTAREVYGECMEILGRAVKQQAAYEEKLAKLERQYEDRIKHLEDLLKTKDAQIQQVTARAKIAEQEKSPK